MSVSTYLQLDLEELMILGRSLDATYEGESDIAALRDKISKRFTELLDHKTQARWIAYRNAVRTDDDLEVDDSAVISEGDDAGAWVMTWTWITHGEADLCDMCGALLDDGEGYDGLCGDCADEEEAQDLLDEEYNHSLDDPNERLGTVKDQS